MFIKVYNVDGNFDKALEVNPVIWMHYNLVNAQFYPGDAEFADGILDPYGNGIYLKENIILPLSLEYYIEISQEEYERLLREEPDLEDTEPQLPEVPEEEVAPELPLTRAELTEKIKELEARNEFLEECLLEMSEIVYGDN